MQPVPHLAPKAAPAHATASRGTVRLLVGDLPLLLASLGSLVLLYLAQRDLRSQDVFRLGQSELERTLALAAGIGAALQLLRILLTPWLPTRPRSRLGRYRLLFVAVVFGWAAILWWARPFTPARVAQFAGTALGLATAIDLLGWFVARWLPLRLVRGVDFALTMVCVLVVALEVGLRGLASVSDSSLLLRPAAGVAEKLGRFRLAPGTMWIGSRVNSGGHFDEEFGPRRPAVPRIVAIGDSFSQGAVPHYYHYTTVLERLLRPLDVCNLGISATGPREYQHLLQTEGLALQPDLVLIGLFVGNDFEEEAEPEYPVLSSWFSAEGSMTMVVGRRLASLWAEQRALGIDDVAGPDQGRGAAGSLADVHWSFPMLTDPLRETTRMTPAKYLETEQSRARRICTEAESARFARCFARLREIVAAAGKVPVVFAIIPDEFQVEDEVWRQVQEDGVEYERDRAQREVKAFCAANGYHCIDLLPDLRAVKPLHDGRPHVYALRNTHWNRRGNEIAAATIARYLVERLQYVAAVPELTVEPFGVGCKGRSGRRPVLSGTVTGDDTLLLQIRDGVPSAPGVLAIGTGREEARLLDTGCRVLVLPLLMPLVPFRTDAAGSCDLPLQLPPGWMSPLFLQAGWIDGRETTATNGLTVALR